MRQDNIRNLAQISSKKHLSRLLCASAAFVLVQATAANAGDGINLGSVGAGTISVVKPNSTHTNITASNGSIGNFNSFDIDVDHFADIIQPNSGSSTLFRVTSGKPSQILGNLHANGKLMLVNSSGVFFGSTAKVDVAGLIASTADTTDADFIAGKMNFSIAGKKGASIVNQGEITATQGGLVALVAPSVRNDGIIEANLGTVALASAETASVDFYGDNLYSFNLGEVTAGDPKSKFQPGVTNTGTIKSEGGKILLTAKVAKNIVDNVINNTGIIEASSARIDGGSIVLDGGDGNVYVGGTLNASGKNGGKITVTGENIKVDHASLNASGQVNGGQIKIGGDYKGGGTLRHAKKVTVTAGSTIDVSSKNNGNGGTAVVWSDDHTDFSGSILGYGGVNGGNGGLAEVSSKGTMSFDGTADLHAKSGSAAGTLMLDPGSLYLGNYVNHVFGGDSYMNVAPLVAVLQGGTNVLVQALNNVSIFANMIWSGAGSLTVDAGNNIQVASNITSSFNGAANQGAINLNAGNNLYVNSATVSTVRGDINTNSVELSMSGGRINSGLGNLIINNSGRFSSSLANVLSGYFVSLNQSEDGGINNAIGAFGTTGAGGGLLTLGSGTWYEAIGINRSNFTLRGQGASTMLTTPSGSDPLTLVMVGPNSNNVTLSNFRVWSNPFYGVPDYGIYAFNNSGLNLNNMSIQSFGVAGVYLQNTVGTQIINSQLSGSTIAIQGFGTLNTNVSGNSFDVSPTSMQFTNDTSLRIQNNNITNSNGTSIILNNVSGAPVTGNSFTNVNRAIQVNGGNSVFISANTFSGIGFGVIANNSSGLSVTGNTMSGLPISSIRGVLSFAGNYAIQVSGGTNTAVTSNTVTNFANGIGVTNSTGNTIRANTLTNTANDAIFLSGSGQSIISNNIVNNATYGIRLQNNSGGQVSNNTVNNASNIGIFGDSNSPLNIANNTVANSRVGIALNASSGSFITNNDINDNNSGVVIENSDNVSLAANRFRRNATGLNFAASQNASLLGDTFINNATAIEILKSSGGIVGSSLTFNGDGVGMSISGAGSSFRFGDNNSRFDGVNTYFVLSNSAMSAGGSLAQADSLDASGQFFEGVRASDFTDAQLADAEGRTIDVEDGPAVGNVFYRIAAVVPPVTPPVVTPPVVTPPATGLTLVGTDLLSQLNEVPEADLFSYAGRTITNNPGVTAPAFDVNTLNLSLLSPAAGGPTPSPAGNGNLSPSQLGNLEPAAGGDNQSNAQSLASLEPAAGGEGSCGNNFLGAGFNTNNFDLASCNVRQQ